MLTGKYLAAFTMITTMISIYYGVTVIEALAIYGAEKIPGSIVTSFIVATLYGMAVLGITLVFSTVLKRTTERLRCTGAMRILRQGIDNVRGPRLRRRTRCPCP